eukprot:scaffold25182_cov62-Phaeocystis_antarctica.AAC.12
MAAGAATAPRPRASSSNRCARGGSEGGGCAARRCHAARATSCAAAPLRRARVARSEHAASASASSPRHRSSAAAPGVLRPHTASSGGQSTALTWAHGGYSLRAEHGAHRLVGHEVGRDQPLRKPQQRRAHRRREHRRQRAMARVIDRQHGAQLQLQQRQHRLGQRHRGVGLTRRARRARARARGRHLHWHLAHVAALALVGEQVARQAHEQVRLLVHALDRGRCGWRAALRGREGLLQLRAALCARLLQQCRRLGHPRAAEHRKGHVALRLRRRRHRLRLVVLFLLVTLERLAARDSHTQPQRRTVDTPRRVVHHGRPAPAVAAQLAQQRDPHLHQHVHRLLLVRHVVRLRTAARAARARRVRGLQCAHARRVHEREQRFERCGRQRGESIAAARHQPQQQHATIHQGGRHAAAALGRQLMQPSRKHRAAVRRRSGCGGGGVRRAAHGGGGVQQHLRAVGVRLTAAVEAVLHRAELHEQLAQRVLERIRRLGPRVLRRRPGLDCGGQQREGAARQLPATQRLAPRCHEIGGRAHARGVEARPLRLALAALVHRCECGAHPLEVPAERRAEQ